jgi:hypothetical protein
MTNSWLRDSRRGSRADNAGIREYGACPTLTLEAKHRFWLSLQTELA